MSPLEQKIQQLEKRIENLELVENVSFIESLKRRLNTSSFLTTDSKLSSLSDVSDTDSASTGQVLKKTSTTWQPGTDNIA